MFTNSNFKKATLVRAIMVASRLPHGEGEVTLELSYDTLDKIDPAFQPLYVERDGKYVLGRVNGLKTQSDIDKLNGALTKERNDHAKVRQNLQAFSELHDGGLDGIRSILERLPELELAANGKIDDAKVNSIVEARLAAKVNPLNLKLTAAEKQLQERNVLIQQYQQADVLRTVKTTVAEALSGSKGFRDSAKDDALMYAERIFQLNDDGTVTTKDNVGVTPGLSPSDWLSEVQPKKPHWWGDSAGGGSRGGDGVTFMGAANPFTHDGWNITKQNELLRSDRTSAEKMAKAAGTTIGGMKPAKK